MSNKAAPAIAGQINHVKVIALALLASIAIILIGFNASAIDDSKGYGLVRINSAPIVAQSVGGNTR